ncbi:hypothetical protein Acr_22g0006660 [Actinidia rufa]|uniref:CCHC-type domain-containing protein n=1 Tax=Actinidia rufa TaxID=165716 RepID=A0A7J0GKJ6_9ERIC|nr:hypothetical protein Acr_22g0006660 [Actinidia rufa]
MDPRGTRSGGPGCCISFNNNHDNVPRQPAMPIPRVEMMNRTTIKQFQQLKPPTFYGTPDPMAAESWLLGIERVFEVLPCTEEQEVIFATFTFDGAALVWWQLKKSLEPVWLWPRFLEVFNDEYFPEMNKVDILRLPTYQEVLQRAIIAERSLNEMSQFRENNRKRSGGSTRRGQSSKRQSSGSSSGNSSTPKRNTVSQGSNRSKELPTCPTCQKKHWGECRKGSTVCYECGQEGHKIRDCPMRNRIQGVGTSAPASVQQPPARKEE